MEGTRMVKVGPISVNAITPEARDLLDKLCEAYEKLYGKESIHNTGSVYSILYWAVRYSGLIEPKINEDNLDEYCKANQELYDELANQFREACRGSDYPHDKVWQKELKERMRCLDLRFKGLGKE